MIAEERAAASSSSVNDQELTIADTAHTATVATAVQYGPFNQIHGDTTVAAAIIPGLTFASELVSMPVTTATLEYAKLFTFAAEYAVNADAISTDRPLSATRYYTFLLTLNFKKRSLYVGLNTPRKRCIFSFTSGIFLPNYKLHVTPKDEKHKQLAYLRSLKHKEKKLAKKKQKAAR